jgi:hypothetical protein
MKQIIGFLKIAASLILLLGLANALSIIYKKYDTITCIVATVSIFAIGGNYIYFLVKTGLWNIKKQPYLINIFLLIGLLFHFIITIWAAYYGSLFTKALMLTTLPFSIVGLSIGIYDSVRFFESWRLKKSELR